MPRADRQTLATVCDILGGTTYPAARTPWVVSWAAADLS